MNPFHVMNKASGLETLTYSALNFCDNWQCQYDGTYTVLPSLDGSYESILSPLKHIFLPALSQKPQTPQNLIIWDNSGRGALSYTTEVLISRDRIPHKVSIFAFFCLSWDGRPKEWFYHHSISYVTIMDLEHTRCPQNKVHVKKMIVA